MSSASAGVSSPAHIPITTAAPAATTSAGHASGGSANGTGRPLAGGAKRSKQMRNAAAFPSQAERTSASTSTSVLAASASSTANVRLLREPGGRPAGLPL
jgi:hypothetical protein